MDIEWIEITGWIDPPSAPAGYTVEVKRQHFMGVVTHYRFVPQCGDYEINPAIDDEEEFL
jgi:hypothetical protein